MSLTRRPDVHRKGIFLNVYFSAFFTGWCADEAGEEEAVMCPRCQGLLLDTMVSTAEGVIATQYCLCGHYEPGVIMNEGRPVRAYPARGVAEYPGRGGPGVAKMVKA